MNDKELLERAIKFEAGYLPVENGVIVDPMKYRLSPSSMVYIEARDSRECRRWAIVSCTECLSKSGQMLYECLPSSRTDNFLDQTRFSSREEAFEFFNKWKAAVLEWAVEEAKVSKWLEVPNDILTRKKD